MELEVRQPAVAGRFYPADAGALRAEVEAYLALATPAPARAQAVIVPHAGYVYSGAVAGTTLGSIEPPACAVIVCPNHTGQGAEVALDGNGAWRLPGGTLAVDGPLGAEICRRTGAVRDSRAHRAEHAIEVVLPFLQAQNPALTIVPLCVGHLSLERCRELGLGIAAAIAGAGRVSSTLLVASTDMSHYLDAESARALDALAIERVNAFDPDGLYEIVTERRISMCGFIPTAACLHAAGALGAANVRLARYANSGERSGDFSRVVGYAGFVVK